jgi:hypothetical protein
MVTLLFVVVHHLIYLKPFTILYIFCFVDVHHLTFLSRQIKSSDLNDSCSISRQIN